MSPGASTFDPIVPPIATAARPEMLGRFVPTAMRRYSPVAKVQRPVRILLLGLLSAGMVPLLQLRERWTRTTNLQAQQFDLSAELLACHIESPEVTAAAKAIRPSKFLTFLSGVAVLTAIVAAIAALTYYGWSLAGINKLYLQRPTDAFAWTWLISLSAGYLIVMWQINQHVAQQQDFALAYNATVEGKAPTIAAPPFVWGLLPVHLLIAGLMMYLWMLWGLPMMLAWAAFASFSQRSDPHFRIQIARSLEIVSGVEPVVGNADTCANLDCRGPMPETAMFCPRCGTPAGGEHAAKVLTEGENA